MVVTDAELIGSLLLPRQRHWAYAGFGVRRAVAPTAFSESFMMTYSWITSLAMLEGARYSAIEALRDGRRVEIRSLRPDDRADLLAAVGRSSGESLYHRFFAVRRGFTESEIAYFLNVDFVNYVALVAVAEERGQPVIVGGGRYVVVSDCGAIISHPGTRQLRQS